MIQRKIGKLLLGKATPFQVLAACIIGSILGFVPGVLQAPGSIVLLLALLAVLNANLWLAALMTLGTKILSFALLPVSHAVGTFLLEGPTEGLFRTLVNAPYFAWCGFEYHAVTGGWAIGTVVGVVSGVVLVKAIAKLRSTFLGLDENSEKFHALVGKFWVRALTWLLLGASPKRATYEKLAGKKLGLPIRPLGAVLVVGIGILCYAVPALLAEPILTGALRTGLERANGATVDLAAAEVDLAEGRFTLSGLAMADRTALEKDALRATTVTADLDVRALLSRRWQIDELKIEQAESGATREKPGVLITKDPKEPSPEPEPQPEPAPEGTTQVTLDDILAEKEKWEEKLAQVRKVLDWVIGDGEEDAESRTRTERAAPRWTRAEHLLEKSPTVLLERLRVARLQALQVGDTLLEVDGWNLSTQPSLVDAPAGLRIASTDGSFRIGVNAPDDPTGAPVPERILFARTAISGDAVGEQLRLDGQPLLRGGTIDIAGDGRWWRENGVRLDVPLVITLNGCEVRIPGSDRLERIETLVLPIRIGGTLTRPKFRFEQKDLIDGLIAAGRQELANRARAEFDKVVGAEVEKVQERIDEEKAKIEEKIDAETDRLKEKIGEQLGDQVDEAVGDALGDEAKKALDKIGGGLFGPKKNEKDE